MKVLTGYLISEDPWVIEGLAFWDGKQFNVLVDIQLYMVATS